MYNAKQVRNIVNELVNEAVRLEAGTEFTVADLPSYKKYVTLDTAKIIGKEFCSKINGFATVTKRTKQGKRVYSRN